MQSGSPHSTPEETGVDRRELLRAGAMLGALWVTPSTELVAMSRRLAATPSPGPCVIYCIKWEVDKQKWEPLGKAPKSCLQCPSDAVNALPDFIDQFTVSGNPEESLTVRFPASCGLVVPDSTPDELYRGSAAAKCGKGGTFGCTYLSADDEQIDPSDPNFKLLTFPVCANGKGISNLQLVIQCCPDPEGQNTT